MVKVVRKLLTILGVKTDEDRVRRFDGSVGKAAGSMRTAADVARDLTGQIKSMAAAYIGFNAAVGAARGLFTANAEYERLGVALETTLQSADAAAAKFVELNQFAQQTPLGLQEITNGFIKLNNMGLNPSIEALTSYGDTASAMGKSLNDMAEAVADAATGEFERLKEFGIRSSSEGDKVTFTFRGVKTTVKKDAAEIENYLIGLGQTNFGGGMAKQAQTLGGLMGRLRDNAFMFSVEVGRGGLNDALRELLELLIANGERSQPLARMIGQTLARAVRGLTEAIRFLQREGRVVRLVLAGIAAAFVTSKVLQFIGAIKGLVAAYKALGTAAALANAKVLLIPALVVALALVLEDLWVFLRGGESAIGDLLAMLEGRGGVLGRLAAGVRNIVPMLQGVAEQVTQVVSRVAERLASMLARAWPAIEAVLGLVLRLLEGYIAQWAAVFEALAPVAEELFVQIGAIIEEIGPLIEEIAGIVGTVIAMVLDLVMAMMPSILEIVDAIMDAIGDVLPMVMESVTEVVGAVVAVMPDIMDAARVIIGVIIDLVRELMPVVVQLIRWLVPLIVFNLKLIVKWTVGIVKVAAPILKAAIKVVAAQIRFWIGVIRRVFEVIGAAFDWFRDNVWTPVTDTLASWWEGLERVITPIIDAVFGAIETAIDTAVGWVMDLIDVAKEAWDWIEKINPFGGDVNITGATGTAMDAISARLNAHAAGAGEGGGAVNVGAVNVTVQGTTSMGPADLARATERGVGIGAAELRKAKRARG